MPSLRSSPETGPFTPLPSPPYPFLLPQTLGEPGWKNQAGPSSYTNLLLCLPRSGAGRGSGQWCKASRVRRRWKVEDMPLQKCTCSTMYSNRVCIISHTVINIIFIISIKCQRLKSFIIEIQPLNEPLAESATSRSLQGLTESDGWEEGWHRAGACHSRNTPPTREGDSGKAELGETIWSFGPTTCLACGSPQCKGLFWEALSGALTL